jgi:hypothetical protein
VKILMTLMILTFTFSSFAFELQFERGNEMNTTQLIGNVEVSCFNSIGSNRTRTYNYYRCNDLLLNGGDYGAVMVVDGSIDADWVKLQREGSRYIKGSRFNAVTGKSKKNYNMWIHSVFQKPLLKVGENIIRYTFTKKKVVVATGSFTVYVHNDVVRQCQRSTIINYGPCPSAYSACQEYYYRQNYCQ